MRSSIAAAALVCATLTFVPVAGAQDTPGRYQMTEVENGMLRLDTQTGDVSYCRVIDAQWICETAADDRVALDDEIATLESENEQLRDRIAELEQSSQEDDGRSLSLPSDEELDRVIGFMERLMRRFYAFTESWRIGEGEET